MSYQPAESNQVMNKLGIRQLLRKNMDGFVILHRKTLSLLLQSKRGTETEREGTNQYPLKMPFFLIIPHQPEQNLDCQSITIPLYLLGHTSLLTQTTQLRSTIVSLLSWIGQLHLFSPLAFIFHRNLLAFFPLAEMSTSKFPATKLYW